MKLISYLLALAGLLAVIYGFIGRFVGAPTVSFFIPGFAMSPTSVFVAGNTLLLLAVLAVLYSKK